MGSDTLFGGLGNDTLVGGGITDVPSGYQKTIEFNFNGITDEVQNGTQISFFGAIGSADVSDDFLDGGDGDDRLFGQGGADTLLGGTGEDLLDGGAGIDTMTGGRGNDTYVVDNASDVVTEYEFEGTDEIYYAISTSLVSNVENVTLVNTTEGAVGNALANRINGNASANFLAGAEGNDTIRGLGGNDRLIGGLGQDTLTGGTGSDKFIFNARNEGIDTITDFETGVDDCVFLGSAFGGLAAGALNPSLFQTGVADQALTASVRFVYEEDTGILRYDSDGSGSAVGIGIATLQAGATMSASDFLIV